MNVITAADLKFRDQFVYNGVLVVVIEAKPQDDGDVEIVYRRNTERAYKGLHTIHLPKELKIVKVN